MIDVDSAIGTNANDDEALPIISIAAEAASIVEGGAGATSSYVFIVSLSAASKQDITVNYFTEDGTATVANQDYQWISSTQLTIAAGVLSSKIEVLVNGDANVEENETFGVRLAQPGNATIGVDSAVGTIENDDHTLPAISGLPPRSKPSSLKVARSVTGFPSSSARSSPTVTTGGALVNYGEVEMILDADDDPQRPGRVH